LHSYERRGGNVKDYDAIESKIDALKLKIRKLDDPGYPWE
jgi:hypothetical protein